MRKFLDAIKSGDLVAVKSLIKDDFDLNAPLEGALCPLYIAAENGHVEIVEEFLAMGANPNNINDDGDTPLLIASFNGHTKVVKALLEKGADFNYFDKEGHTALHLAVQDGHVEVVNRLLEIDGININIANFNGFTSLHFAAERNRVEIAEKILEKDISSIDYGNNSGCTALHLAALNGNYIVVKLLLDKIANIDARDINGFKALHSAAYVGHINIVEMILKLENNIEKKKLDIYDVLLIAFRMGKIYLAMYFLNKESNLIDKYDVLLLAIENDSNELIKFILQKDFSFDFNKYKDLLSSAVNKGNVVILETLLNHIDMIKEETKMSVLNLLFKQSIEGNKTEIVRFLIDKGVDPNPKDDMWKDLGSPILAAVRKRNVAMAKLLLDKGASKKSTSYSTEGTLLDDVLYECPDLRMVEMLLDNGFRVNYDDDYEQPLSQAIRCNDIGIVKLLLSRGANVNHSTQDMETPILLARSNIKMLKVLLDAGADINYAGDSLGYTSLLNAVDKKNFKVVKFLLERYADVNKLSFFEDESPLNLAIKKLQEEIKNKKLREKHLKVVNILIKYDADVNYRGSDGYNAKQFLLTQASSEARTDIERKNMRETVDLINQAERWSPLRRVWCGIVARLVDHRCRGRKKPQEFIILPAAATISVLDEETTRSDRLAKKARGEKDGDIGR